MTPMDHFWETLAFLVRPDDPDHNAALIRDFAKASGISEDYVRLRLNLAMRLNGSPQ
jgi:hypothetical protein